MAGLLFDNADILVGGYNLSGDANQLGLAYTATMLDGTTFGATTKINTPGLLDIQANAQGFTETSAFTGDSALFADVSLTALLTLFANGITEGTTTDKGYAFNATPFQYNPIRGLKVGDLLGWTFQAKAAGQPLVRAIPLKNATVTALTATGNGSGFNLGAVLATQFVYGGLHVVAASGTTPSLTVTIQSSADNTFAAPTTRISFAAQTVTGAVYATRVAGAITDAYWRATWTISGTTPSFKILVWMGIQ